MKPASLALSGHPQGGSRHYFGVLLLGQRGIPRLLLPGARFRHLLCALGQWGIQTLHGVHAGAPMGGIVRPSLHRESKLGIAAHHHVVDPAQALFLGCDGQMAAELVAAQIRCAVVFGVDGVNASCGIAEKGMIGVVLIVEQDALIWCGLQAIRLRRWRESRFPRRGLFVGLPGRRRLHQLLDRRVFKRLGPRIQARYHRLCHQMPLGGFTARTGALLDDSPRLPSVQ